MLDVLIKRIKEISGKECIFGFINDYALSSMSSGGKFILQPESQESRTIGLNHRKERVRKLKLLYGKMNKIKTGSIEEVKWVENFLEELEKDRELLGYIINLDHYYIVNNEKKDEDGLTGYIIFEINLDIKER